MYFKANLRIAVMDSVSDKVVINAIKVQLAECNLAYNGTHLMCAERAALITRRIS